MAALHNLDLPQTLADGIRISESMFITSDPTRITSWLTPGFQHLAGALEVSVFTTQPAAAYSTVEIAAGSDFVVLDQLLVHELQQLDTFLTCLWLLRDHCVETEMGFLVAGGLGTSNNLRHAVSTAHGVREVTRFRGRELREAGRLMQRLWNGAAYFKVSDDTWPPHAGVDGVTQLPQTGVMGGTPRLSRALYFAQTARTQFDLAVKLANYITALETLFATSTGELTHRLAERVAVVLGETLDERQSIYRSVKAAYAARSKVVHGDTIAKPHSLREVSVACDDLVRRSLLRVMNDPEVAGAVTGSTTVLDEYFAKLLFG